MKLSISYFCSTEGLSTYFWIKKILEQSPYTKTFQNVLQSSTVFHSRMFYKVLHILWKILQHSRKFQISLFLLDSSIYIMEQ